MDNQETLQRINHFTNGFNNEGEARINKLMDYTVTDFNGESNTLTVSFAVAQWMLNPTGSMHGGLISTAFDIASGTMAVVMAGFKRCPTVELNVNFIKPVFADDTLVITVKCQNVGRFMCHLSGEGYSQKTGQLSATSTAIFFCGGDAYIPNE